MYLVTWVKLVSWKADAFRFVSALAHFFQNGHCLVILPSTVNKRAKQLVQVTILMWNQPGCDSVAPSPSIGLQHSSNHCHNCLHCWCSCSNRFLIDNSDCCWGFSYYHPHCLRHHKQDKNHLNWDGTDFFTQGKRASCFHACLDTMLFAQSCQYPDLLEGAERASVGSCMEIKSAPSVV